MLIVMFSMAGIPPFVGFYAKLAVLAAAVDAGHTWLAVAGVIFSVIGAFYYLRVIKLMYFDGVGEPLDRTLGRELRFVMFGTSVLILLFFLYPEPVLSSAGAAAAALFPG